MFSSKGFTSLRGIYSRVANSVKNVRNNSYNSRSMPSMSVPTVGVMVGCCALSFQIFVLYPWHHELSEQFNNLQVNIVLFFSKLPKYSHRIPPINLQRVIVKVEAITTDLDARLNKVIKLEEEVKLKERRILDKEEEILKAERDASAKLDILLSRQHL
jgi:hypothetical protein